MTRRLLSAASVGLLLAATSVAGAADGRQGQPPRRAPVVVQVHGDGFHWGDAAIGAAATLGVMLAGAGGVLFLTRTPPSERKNHA